MAYSLEIVCASVFTLFCTVFAGIYIVLNRAYTYWDKKNVNGPIPVYGIGTWKGFSQMFFGTKDCADVKKYGKVYGTYDGFIPNLLVAEPDLIKDVVDPTNENLQDIRVASQSSVILKDSFLSLCGGEKSDVQILTSSLLSPHKLEKVIPKLEASVETLIRQITNERQDGQINITSSITDFIDLAIAETILGIDLNADVQFKEEFVKHTKQIFKVKEPKSYWTFLPFLFLNEFKQSWVCPEKTLQYFVNLIISGISDTSSETKEEKACSLVKLMTEAAEEEKKLVKKEKEEENPDIVLTDNAIISKCIASMFTLVNATRTTVIMGVHSLADNEEIQEKLFKEVEKHKSEKLSYEEIQNLNYLDKVVKEVLRLYPFEFRLERVSTGKFKLGDVEIYKQDTVSIPLYALHRLEEYYPDPEKFDPERFSQSSSENRSAFTYLPFGQAGFNGSDISLQLGVLAAKVTLYRLVEKFKFSEIQQKGLDKLFQHGFTGVPLPDDITVLAETRI